MDRRRDGMVAARVAVLGGGMFSPIAASSAAVLATLHSGSGAPAPLPPVSASELAFASGLPAREVRKLDRFSLLAVAAARRALHDAGLEPDRWRACGILTGNVMAGWTFTEPQLRALHADGPHAVSPYLATAWFPAAPQGQISIHLGLTGFAKTITTDRCAGAHAIGLAFERVLHGRDRLLLAGGVEAPQTPLVEIGVDLSPEVRGPVREGAAFVVLAAGAGGGPAIAGYESRPVAPETPYEALEELLGDLAALGMGLPPLGALLVDLPPGSGLETAVLRWVRGAGGVPGPEVLFPTRLFGETLAASAALGVELARRWLLGAREPASVAVVAAGPSTVDLLWLVHEPFQPKGDVS